MLRYFLCSNILTHPELLITAVMSSPSSHVSHYVWVLRKGNGTNEVRWGDPKQSTDINNANKGTIKYAGVSSYICGQRFFV